MKPHTSFWILICLFILPLGMDAQESLKVKDLNGNVLLVAREDGVLIRKMTTPVRTAIAGLNSSHNGLMVYDTDSKSIWIWHDSDWKELDGIDLVDDADSDPSNELQNWLTLPGKPSGFEDGIDDVNDADSDPTNELQTWLTLPGIPAAFSDGTDDVNDSDSDPTNELQNWLSLPGKPSGFEDGIDDVNDADSDPTNELQSWLTLPGIPAAFADGTDNVNDADSDPLNEKNTTLTRNGTQIELTDAGGMLTANIGWAIASGKVFNTTDQVGIGTNAPQARLTVQDGSILFNGTVGSTPVSGAGTRMMWIPSKHAFRAGIVTSTQWDNSNIGIRSFVGGGTDNIASAWNSIVAGGGLNSATADGAFAGGGYTNTASGINSFISGGEFNTASGYSSSVAAGVTNSATGQRSFIGGGTGNIASGWNSIVAGGGQNSAIADGSFVGGGFNNSASGVNSFIGSGLSNTTTGYASFASGRESNASGNHAMAGGLGLFAKSFGETVFGSYNSDYTPSSAIGIVNTDRLFVVGNGTSTNARSNAMTILKNGNVGIGADDPDADLHVVGSKGIGEHIMLIENQDHTGSGLKIKIDGSHPIYVQGEGGNPDFFVTRPINALEIAFEEIGGDIRDYLLSGESLSLTEINLNEINSPAGLIDQMGLTEFVSGGICKGVSNLVDYINETALSPIQLPDLPLDGIPADLPNIPSFPLIPTVAPFSLDPPALPPIWIPFPVSDYIVINLPPFSFPASNINSPINGFNSNITSINSTIGNVNTGIETGYDQVRSGVQALDDLTIPLPQFQMPASIGPVTCPENNPWDEFDISFEKINPFDYTIENSLSKSNDFITFVDKYDNKLGAIESHTIAEFNQDYFKLEKVLEIGGAVVGLFQVDGGVFKNVAKLAKEAIKFYKESDKMGVSYSSGHGDYAEWLEREDHTEDIGYGDIIGIRSGKISLSVEGAEQVMVVSKAPIVLGNTPLPGNEMNGNNIAFIGQVPAKVLGPVHTGDYIVANPSTPGYAIAIPENEITADQFALAVGRSWETNATPGFKFVNTIVGMHSNGWAVPVKNLTQRIADHEAAINSLMVRLDNLEASGNMVSGNNKRER